jgi:hypothetical protein
MQQRILHVTRLPMNGPSLKMVALRCLLFYGKHI